MRMRALVQRTSRASVMVGGRVAGEIGEGLVVFVCAMQGDGEGRCERLARKVVNLRIFADDTGVMNRSVLETGGDILAVSQFTLYASTRKGNRPSWSAAAPPGTAEPAFNAFVATPAAALGRPVATGVFGADMAVGLVNDGPVTIWLDSRARE
jgi:D-tyrosyl-tRNA(Tyr) deacylase